MCERFRTLPTKLLSPAIIRHLAHADLTNRLHSALSCDSTSTCRNFALLRLVSFPRIAVLLDAKRHTSGRTSSAKRIRAWRDNVFVERLWRSVKYEEVYLRAY